MISIGIKLCEISTTVLTIGMEGENNHTCIVFDASSVLHDHPDASVSLSVQSPAGTIYPKTVQNEGQNVLWVVSDSDSASEGTGQYQLTFTHGEEIIKTFIGCFRVFRSLIGSGPAPGPVADWLEEAQDALDALDHLSASAVDVSHGTPAAARITEVDGHKNIEISVPAGESGSSAYVWIRYAAAQPTSDADLKTTPDAWIGICSGDIPSAPVHYTDYAWYQIKGDPGASVDVQINGTSIVNNGVANITSEAVGVTTVETVSGGTPSITGAANKRYICGECSTLSITAPASGIIDVVFESGSTATVLTVTSAKTGVSAVKWANGFDPTSLDANTVYEINIMDGEYGVVGKWT